MANNGIGSDGIPTLKRVQIEGDTLATTTTALVNGIENLQLEYGLDTNADGVADVFTTNPATHAACAAPACAVTNWGNVVSTKLSVLARSLDPTTGYTDSKTYVLGALSDGSANQIAATNDHYKRHVYQTLVVLPNPTGRKIPRAGYR